MTRSMSFARSAFTKSSTRCRMSASATVSSFSPRDVKHGQIELAEPLRVVEDVDLGDVPAADRERHDRERLSFEHTDQPRGAVDEDRSPENPESGESQRS